MPKDDAAEPVHASDGEIIDALLKGEPHGGEALYNHLVDAVESALWRVLGSRGPDHEDLVQSAFEQIVVSLMTRRFAHACSLRSWAVAITCNLALNTVRSRGVDRKLFDRQHDTETLQSATWRSDPERDADARRDLASVRALLATMSPKLAQTVILHDVLGHDLAEIAVLTGVSVSAAQSRLVRGRRTLEALLVTSGLREAT